MIGIVVVSHSRALADAAVALATEMTDAEHRPVIEVAAGLDEATFGTDAMAVSEAITRADSGDGVLVLLDLGSAVLSAEMALEFLDPDLAERVRLSSAPLVEGLVGAAVAAGAGADLSTAAGEAEAGLAAKTSHLTTSASSGTVAEEGSSGQGEPWGGGAIGGSQTGEQESPDRGDSSPEGEGGLTRVLDVTAPHGLHARPAARFVREVGRHPDVQVQVRNLDTGSGPVDGRSLSGVATLDARQGHRIEVSAHGEGAAQLMDDLATLAGTGFGDLDPSTADQAPTRDTAVPRDAQPGPGGPTQQGSGAAAKGPTFALEAAVGPVVRLGGPVPLEDYESSDPEQELARLDEAVARARTELTKLVAHTTQRVGASAAEVFDAHLGLLDDPGLMDPVRDGIRSGSSAPEAVQQQTARLRAQFEGLADPYQRERGADVTSVGERLLRALVGAEPADHQRAGVLVVHELDPATAVQLNPTEVLGVITVGGAGTGHGVLLARARGVPVLTGATAARDVAEGTLVAFDARARRLVIDPDVEERGEFEALLSDRAAMRERIARTAADPAVTLDGHRVRVKANLGSVADAALAAASGADGSGLVRTEALFGSHQSAPTVAEQVRTYSRISEDLSGAVITIRTWDVGGDKPLPFHPQAPEANPFLGQRGLRAFWDDPRLLVDQLEAVCRVAREARIRVMFPMVATVEEVEWALARLEEAAGRLPDGRPDTLEVGIMIEVPAAALRPEALSTLLDFVSIGSNDLTQYVLAAERGNPALDDLADVADPAVLQLIRETARGVAEGVEVCLCGDAASDPALAQLLVGLGVTELSATAASVPAVKDALRQVSLTDLQDLAQRALRANSAAEVREMLRHV